MTERPFAALPPLERLVAVMDRLRSPGGCPWDAEQTHESLVEYLLEEAHETIEAIEAHDRAALAEELGDLLLQVVFHARIASEADDGFTIEDVATGITEKLIARHPHVFGPQSGEPITAEEVAASWTIRKSREKGRSSAVDGIPMSLPALALAQKSWRRAQESGVVVEHADEGAIGTDLMAIVIRAEASGVDAEAELRGVVRRLHGAIRAAEVAGGTARPGR